MNNDNQKLLSAYAEQNGYKNDEFDELEVYEKIFHDPTYNDFKLLIPII